MVECKIFSGVKYFRESKIFSSVWLYYENCSIKCFHVFGYILEMLFSYYLLTFSQLPNKFYNRKFQYINLKKQKSKQHQSVKLREGGRESDQKWRKRERSVMGHRWRYWSWVTRLRLDRSWVMTRSRGRHG